MSKWYEKEATEALRELQSNGESGLTQEQVVQKRAEYGENKFAEQKKEGLGRQILRQLSDISIIILLFAAGLSFALALREGHGFIEPIVILAIIIMNLILAITQERSAERAMDALAGLSSPTCLVIRNGVQQEIDTVQVVPGDIIVLKTGNLVPADARLISANSLQVDESSLTGESEPAEKDHSASLEGKVPLGDQINMVFLGCMVMAGQGMAVVTAIGMQTQMGRISSYLQADQKSKTPLQNRLDKVGKIVSFIAIVSAIFLFAVGTIQGEEFWHMVLLAVSLAVAAVPETLNLIVTLSLTHGVKNMANKNALIRKLQAVETLGSVSIICSDKTGTLTQNRMTIKRLWLYGTEPIKETDEFAEDQLWFMQKLALASSATVERGEDGSPLIMGDSTESAIMRILLEKGTDLSQLKEQYPKVAEIPFSSARKMMTTVLKKPEGDYLVLTKGAFDRIPFDRKDYNYQRELETVHDSMAGDALRVIALASRTVDELPIQADLEQLEANLTFEGLIGLIDPPRPEAAEAIKQAKKAGIRTIMITGDHAATASAIARELGIIAAKEGVLTGQELEELSDEELCESIQFYSVYARVSPEDKIRIVKAWQQREEVVSMTGDGVNDAPALQAADVGVAMGISGTDVAKSAADVVLTDDCFATILDATVEGRNVFSNIRKTIYFLIVCNISEIVIILGCQMIGWGMPITPMMLLIINVLGDGIPGLTLAKERSDPRIMTRRPIARDESFFGGGLLEVMIQQIITFAIVTWAGYYIGAFVSVSDSFIPSHSVAQTMSFLILSFTSILHIFTVKSRKSIFKTSFRDNPQLGINAGLMILVFTGMTAIAPIASVLGFAAISGLHWLIVIALSIIPTLVAEYEKMWDSLKQSAAEKNRVVRYRIK